MGRVRSQDTANRCPSERSDSAADGGQPPPPPLGHVAPFNIVGPPSFASVACGTDVPVQAAIESFNLDGGDSDSEPPTSEDAVLAEGNLAWEFAGCDGSTEGFDESLDGPLEESTVADPPLASASPDCGHLGVHLEWQEGWRQAPLACD